MNSPIGKQIEATFNQHRIDSHGCIASHYDLDLLIVALAELAHELFRQGYEAGFREGRASAGKPLSPSPDTPKG